MQWRCLSVCLFVYLSVTCDVCEVIYNMITKSILIHCCKCKCVRKNFENCSPIYVYV